jgi:signal transduction histidine kinase
MVLGEGLVFFLILIIGFFITFKSLKKEIKFSQQQRNFLLSITHELKTPIAAIKLYLQTIQRRKPEADKLEQMILKSLIENERLNTLVENILTVTKMEDQAYPLNKEIFNLSEFIEDVGLKIMDAQEKSINFEFILQPDVEFNGDKNALYIVLINLIGNAIKYSEEGSNLTISLFQKNGETAFSIADEGPGIAKEEKDEVFKKFYRIGNESTRTNKGTGLGLFIVKQIVQLHGGRAFVKRNKPKGSIFVCSFPPVQ